MYAFSRFKVCLYYTLKPVTLELLCKRKIDLNQFITIAAPPSRWGEGGVYQAGRLNLYRGVLVLIKWTHLMAILY